MSAAIQTRGYDALAVALSGLCVIHCLALPVAASALPILGLWAEAEWTHWAFVMGAGALSFAAFRRGATGRGAALILATAGVGLSLLMAGAAGWPNEGAETVLTVLGGFILSAAHLLNWRRSSSRQPRRQSSPEREPRAA